MKHDPIEDTEEYKKISDEVDKKIKEKIGDEVYMGYCHLYWATKKEILKNDYNIDWKSPSELNPHIIFD